MAREIVEFELPTGEIIDFDVPAGLDDDAVQALAVKNGLFDAPAEPESDMPDFDEADKPETEPKVTFGDRFMRQQELGARAVIEGGLGFPLMIGDAANTALNFIPGVDLGMPSQAVREALPLAEPETPGERIASTIVQAGTGTAGGIKTASKLTTGEVKRFLTEEAGQQLAVGTAAGAGMGLGAEADLGPVGQLMTGLMGGLAGGVGARQAVNQFGKWADQRALDKTPVTLEEVKAQVEATGSTASNAELRNLRESLDEMRTAQKVDEEIRSLRPVESDPLLTKRAKAAAIRRLGGTDKANLPVEVRREQDRIRRSQIAETEAKLRDAEARAANATPEMKQVNQHVVEQNKRANAASDVLGGGNEGRPTWISTLGNDVIGRINRVAPQLGTGIRRVSQRSATRTTDDIKRIREFYRSTQMNSLSKQDRSALDRAFLNEDAELAGSIMAKAPGLEDLYNTKVRSLLSDVQKERVAGGLDGFVENFHPRAVRHLRALQRSRGKEVAGEVEQALHDARRSKGMPLDEHEVASLINQRIGGRPLKQLRDRRINEITPEQQKFYANSEDSLIDYLHAHHSAVATKDFFKHNLGVDRGLNQTMDEQSLGRLLAKEMEEGRLSGPQLDELAPLLSAHFGVGRQGVGGFQRNMKNLFTTGVLANPLSTVTQIGDIAPLMKKFGVRETLAALVSPKALDVYDVGVREASKDMRTAHGTTRLVRDGLKAFGFEKLDKIMANTGVNAAFSKWTKAARRNPELAKQNLRDRFGADTDQLIADLAAGRRTDDVKTLLFSEMGDIRPVGREDMPLMFQKHPNGRFLFSLLSWTMKQANFVRNSALADIKAGKKTKATKDFISFLLLMGLTNGSAQSIKDFVRGEEIDLASNLAQGALSIGMSGKYAFDALGRQQAGEAMGSIIPFLGIMFGVAQGGFNAIANGEPTEIVDSIPSMRNLQMFMEGPVPQGAAGLVGAGVDALIPEAQAARHGVFEQPAQLDAHAQAQLEQELAEGEAGFELPEGSRLLPEGMTGSDIDAARTAEIEAEDVEVQIDDHLELREGNRSDSYRDSEGKLTGGIGHLMSKAEQAKYPEGTEVPEEVRKRWFEQDSAKAKRAAKLQTKVLNEPRLEAALASVNFQLGTQWFKEHKKTWALMKEGKWEEAAVEAADSRWNEQTPVRVRDLQDALRSL